jgi:transposase
LAPIQRAQCKLEKIPGVGPITPSALVATVGDAKSFESARQMSAWMGLVPRQSSKGGKTTLLGISKRGDTYLRTLLIHGARSVVRTAERRRSPDDWLIKLQQRRTHNVCAVALANKNARMAWALLARDREFQRDYRPATAAL